MQNKNSIVDLDHQHIWHPYASRNLTDPLYQVQKAEGCYLTFSGGRQVIDGMSSWWSTIHGYQHPNLDLAVKTQLSMSFFVIRGQLVLRLL